jgi:HSP20 family protein
MTLDFGHKNPSGSADKGSVQGKKESHQTDTTHAAKTYSPLSDIFETKQALILTLDMPGVDKDQVTIKLENDLLEIEGKVDPSLFERKKPLYSEYNVGHFYRRFLISNKINRDHIEAKMLNGVLTLTLPKGNDFGPKKIPIS